MTVRLLDRSGAEIDSVATWTRPKKVDLHWKLGRSAMSLAEAWFRGGSAQPPRELVELLESHLLTRGAVLEEGRPEFVTKLPMKGEGRNHDLWLVGKVGRARIGVGIEAKADEPFDQVIGERVEARKLAYPRTGLPARSDNLLRSLFGAEASWDRLPWAGLRYQLVSGAAGTLIQAKTDGAPLAVLAIHEFHNHTTRPERLAQNLADYRRFLELLIPGDGDTTPGKLLGPVSLPEGSEYAGIRLFVGRIVTEGGVP